MCRPLSRATSSHVRHAARAAISSVRCRSTIRPHAEADVGVWEVINRPVKSASVWSVLPMHIVSGLDRFGLASRSINPPIPPRRGHNIIRINSGVLGGLKSDSDPVWWVKVWCLHNPHARLRSGENQVHTCRTCYDKGVESRAHCRWASSDETGGLMLLAKRLWRGDVWECDKCGVILSTRQQSEAKC